MGPVAAGEVVRRRSVPRRPSSPAVDAVGRAAMTKANVVAGGRGVRVPRVLEKCKCNGSVHTHTRSSFTGGDENNKILHRHEQKHVMVLDAWSARSESRCLVGTSAKEAADFAPISANSVGASEKRNLKGMEGGFIRPISSFPIGLILPLPAVALGRPSFLVSGSSGRIRSAQGMQCLAL
jgi:hypothetical protein